MTMENKNPVAYMCNLKFKKQTKKKHKSFQIKNIHTMFVAHANLTFTIILFILRYSEIQEYTIP